MFCQFCSKFLKILKISMHKIKNQILDHWHPSIVKIKIYWSPKAAKVQNFHKIIWKMSYLYFKTKYLLLIFENSIEEETIGFKILHSNQNIDLN